MARIACWWFIWRSQSTAVGIIALGWLCCLEADFDHLQQWKKNAGCAVVIGDDDESAIGNIGCIARVAVGCLVAPWQQINNRTPICQCTICVVHTDHDCNRHTCVTVTGRQTIPVTGTHVLCYRHHRVLLLCPHKHYCYTHKSVTATGSTGPYCYRYQFT
jgi:hypothetical protein